MGNTFTQAVRCWECAYVDCRCGKLSRPVVQAQPVSRPAVVQACRCGGKLRDALCSRSDMAPSACTAKSTRQQPRATPSPIQARAAELAPAKVKASVLPPGLAEIRERMRRGEVVPLTGPGSLAEALKTPTKPSAPAPKPAPPVEDVQALFNEQAPNGVRVGDLIMDGILNATQAKLSL